MTEVFGVLRGLKGTLKEWFGRLAWELSIAWPETFIMPTINHNDGVYTSAWLITKKGLHSFKWTIAIGVLDTPINAEEDNQLRHESEFIKLLKICYMFHIQFFSDMSENSSLVTLISLLPLTFLRRTDLKSMVFSIIFMSNIYSVFRTNCICTKVFADNRWRRDTE